MLDQHLKQRLIGAAVLVSLAVIFIPMLLDGRQTASSFLTSTNIPPKPESDFVSRVMPLEAEPVAPPGKEADAPAPDEEPVQVAEKPQEGPAASADETRAEDAAKPTAPKQDAGPENAEDADGVRVGLTAWVVQLGSFSSQKNAMGLRDQLRDKGYAAFVEPFYGEQGKAFRVRVGPELDKEGADELSAKLHQVVELKGIVVRYP